MQLYTFQFFHLVALILHDHTRPVFYILELITIVCMCHVNQKMLNNLVFIIWASVISEGNNMRQIKSADYIQCTYIYDTCKWGIQRQWAKWFFILFSLGPNCQCICIPEQNIVFRWNVCWSILFHFIKLHTDNTKWISHTSYRQYISCIFTAMERHYMNIILPQTTFHKVFSWMYKFKFCWSFSYESD